MISLTTLTDEQLARARYSHRGRAAYTIHGGHDHVLRQKIVALSQGHRSLEDCGPGEAMLQVLRGHVVLSTGRDTCNGTAGEFFTIPPGQHSLEALEDSAVLLTVFTDHQPISSSAGVSDGHRFSHVR